MKKEIIIKQAVENSYNNLKIIADLKISCLNGYFGIIIPDSQIQHISQYADDIVNNLYNVFCSFISKNLKLREINNIEYQTFCLNSPSEELLQDCYHIVKNDIKKIKNNLEVPNLLNSLSVLEKKYKKNELRNSLNTIFDIVLTYYTFIEN